MRSDFSRAKASLFLAALFLFCRTAPTAAGEGVAVTVSGPAAPVVAGSTTGFQLNVLNPSDQPVVWSFPPELRCRLVAGPNTTNVTAGLTQGAEQGPATLAPGTFARREYAVKLPERWAGEVIVELEDFPAVRLVFDVQNAPAAATATAPPKKGLVPFLKGHQPAAEGAAYDPEEFFKAHIFGYEPFYFIAGTKTPNAKIQISFK